METDLAGTQGGHSLGVQLLRASVSVSEGWESCPTCWALVVLGEMKGTIYGVLGRRRDASSFLRYLLDLLRGGRPTQSPAARENSVKCRLCQVASEDLTVLCRWAAAGWSAGEGTSLCGSQGAQQLASLLSGRWGVCCYNCGFLRLFPVLSLQAVLWATVFSEPRLRQGQAWSSPRASVGHRGTCQVPQVTCEREGLGEGWAIGTWGFR